MASPHGKFKRKMHSFFLYFNDLENLNAHTVGFALQWCGKCAPVHILQTLSTMAQSQHFHFSESHF